MIKDNIIRSLYSSSICNVQNPIKKSIGTITCEQQARINRQQKQIIGDSGIWASRPKVHIWLIIWLYSYYKQLYNIHTQYMYIHAYTHVVWIVSFQKIYQALSPSTCDFDFIWEYGVCKYTEVKMRSYWIMLRWIYKDFLLPL